MRKRVIESERERVRGKKGKKEDERNVSTQ